MKNSIYYITLFFTFIFLNSCSTDEFIQTEVGLQYSTYTGKVGDIDTIYATFKNGRNNKYKTEFILSSTNAKVIASSYNYAVIQYTSIGTGDLTLKFYAKGSMISEATATIITNNLGGGGVSNSGLVNKIYFHENYGGKHYYINADGTSKTEIFNFKDIKNAVLSQDGKSIYYSDINDNYTGEYKFVNQQYSDQYVSGYVQTLNTTIDNYIVMIKNYNTAEICSALNSTKQYFRPYYYNTLYNNVYVNDESFYIHKYNGSASSAIYLSTCYANNYYSLDFINAGNHTNIYAGTNLDFKKFKVSPNGSYIGCIIYNSYNSSYSLKIYDVDNNKSIGEIYNSYYQINDFQFNKDGSQIVFSAKSGYNSYNDLFVKNTTNTVNSATNITNSNSLDEILPDWK